MSGSDEHLSPSEWAHRYFYNPRVPRAIKDDPDGSFHFRLQISDADGKPLKNLRKDDPIPLYLRWYQRKMVDDPNRYVVFRCARRTGKTFAMGVIALVEALRNPSASVLIMAPHESHIKLIFDENIRPLLRTYRHRKSGRVGIPTSPSGQVPPGCDFVIAKDTQKPHEIVITDGKDHRATIRGLIISNSARGQSASLIICDEADYASTEAIQAIVAPIIMTTPETRVVLSSTPTGRRDSFFYERCHDSKWSQHHYTFKVLPHYNEELHRQMAIMAGGENTNTFRREYLAEFGEETSGVFDQVGLNMSFIVSPYVSVLEDYHPATRERTPVLAHHETVASKKLRAYYEAVRPVDHPVGDDSLGAESVYRPEYLGHGIITAGTDWNTVAGMQTVIIWWPPESWLKQGLIRVARFPYRQNEPDTTRRWKEHGRTRSLVVGSTNGDPGGPADLQHVKGIVIWHGRLEAGYFNWQSAANRAVALMAIPNFIDAWYVDYGYGEQVIKMIEGIMASGEYLPDQHILTKSMPIDARLLRNIRAFHPENDPNETGKIFKPIRFGDVYPSRDIDFQRRDDRYKDVMVSLAKRMITGRELLLPYGELVDYMDESLVGTDADGDRDEIELNGAAPARDHGDFGGLITQMRAWRVAGVSPTGRPRYDGADHAIDAFMLALLAYWENYSPEGPGNMFNRGEPASSGELVSQPLVGTPPEIEQVSPRVISSPTAKVVGDLKLKSYRNEREPLNALLSGRRRAAEVGTSLAQMLKDVHSRILKP